MSVRARNVLLVVLSLLTFLVSATGSYGLHTPAKTTKKLIVGVVNDPPACMKNDRGQWTGFNVDLWRFIAVDLGLEYEFKEMNFEEIREALRKKKIDISIAALYQTAARYRDFDFSTTIGASRLAVAIPADKDSHPFMDALRIFFSWGVIHAIILFAVLLFGLGALLWWIERERNPDHFGGHPMKGIGAGTYWVSSTLAAGTCFDVTLKSMPARFIGLIWIFLGALAFSAFTASLASSLVAHRQVVETYDMSKLRSMRLGVVMGSLQEDLAKKMGDRYRVYDDEKTLMSALAAGKVDAAFISDLTLSYYAAREPAGRLHIHPLDFKPQRHAFAFPKGSPLRRPVNIALADLMDGAEWDALATRYGLDNNLNPERMNLGKRSHFSP